MQTTDNRRRRFLLALGLGGLGAATALVAGRQPAAQPGQNVTPQAATGYRPSEHINTYYRTARI